MVKEIGKILGTETYMPTYDNGEYGVKEALDMDHTIRLVKKSTDYAKAILGQYSSHQPYYRGEDVRKFSPYDHAPFYDSYRHQFWWLGTQYPAGRPTVYHILSNGRLNNNHIHCTYGVVVCLNKI